MQTIFGCYGSGTAKEDLTNQHWNDRREIVGLDQGSAISSRAYFATSKLLYVSSHRRCRVSSRTRQRYFQTVEFFLTTGFRLSEQLIVSRLSTTCSRTGCRPLRLKLRKQLSFLFLPFSFFFFFIRPIFYRALLLASSSNALFRPTRRFTFLVLMVLG